MTMIPVGLLGTIVTLVRGRPKAHWLGGTLACFVAAAFLPRSWARSCNSSSPSGEHTNP
jgi:hypothetical protein